MMSPKISICIASKNRESDLLRCLTSIAAQRPQPLEIIVLDQSAIPYSLPQSPQLRYLHDESLTGLTAARNRGWSLATGELVVFFDDDVEVLPGCLEALAESYRAHPEAVGFQCAIEGLVSRLSLGKMYGRVFHRGFFDSDGLLVDHPMNLKRLFGCAMAFRSSALQGERFDENLVGYAYGEDWEFSLRARRRGRLVLVKDARVIHHTSPVNRFKTEEQLKARWEAFNYFYEKLEGGRYWPNRFWHFWWELGESIHWLRFGMGFPVLGIWSSRVPNGTLIQKCEREKGAV